MAQIPSDAIGEACPLVMSAVFLVDSTVLSVDFVDLAFVFVAAELWSVEAELFSTTLDPLAPCFDFPFRLRLVWLVCVQLL